MYIEEQQRELRNLREEVEKLRRELCKRADRKELLRERIMRFEAEQEASDLRETVHLLRLEVGSAKEDLRAENEYLREELERSRRRNEDVLRESIEAELLYRRRFGGPTNNQT